MALLKILEYPHPVLKKKAEQIKQIDGDIKNILSNMLETMYNAPGIGLAAPQIGISKRMIVLDVSENKNEPYLMINPEIIWESEDENICQEGCLSVPEQYADVIRPSKIKVKYQDMTGKEQELKAEGLLATCIQHEIDHLDGVLFIDHISRIKRNMLIKKLKNAQKQRVKED